MYIKRAKGPVSIRLADGKVLTRSDLPEAGTERWVASRKAIVVTAVDNGLITAEEAQDLYAITIEELDSWRSALSRHGVLALRTTALQRYRPRAGTAADGSTET